MIDVRDEMRLSDMRGTGADHPLQPGERVGTYQLQELIGGGSISQVWRAHLPSDERRPVAIKILSERVQVQDAARDHFRLEAELMMRVRCPQILRVFNYERTQAGRPYIVMELLEGHDLKEQLAYHGPLSIEEALMVGIELLKALSELHRAGHVHSDLKPENVYLLKTRSHNGALRVKLIDFGSAVSLNNPAQRRLTEGTYLYMAPEQLRRQPLSPATDLYGLGALMFTLISGRPPFQPTLADGLDAHLSQPVPKLRERVPSAPVQLERLLELCLNPKAEQRPASADALRRTLERLLNERQRRPALQDSFLPADEGIERGRPQGSRPPQISSSAPQRRSSPPVAFSVGPAPYFEDDDDANPQELLRWLLKSYTAELAEDWARSISETPSFGRAQPHMIKVNATYYLTLFSQAQGRRLPQGFLQLIDQLTPNPNPKAPEIAPLMSGPLLTPSLNRYMGDWSDEVQDAVRGELYDLFYTAHQSFIEAMLVRYPNEYEAQLKRAFSHSVELSSLSTLSGQLRYTQPGLRGVFGASDEAQLKQRDLFELLSGYQGLLSIKRDFKELREGQREQFERFSILHHPHAKGRALTLKMSPHLLKREGGGAVMILFEVLEERQVVEPLSAQELADDYAPQAPLWVETMEVSALGHERLDELYAQPIGEDEPTPIPGAISPSMGPLEVDWGAELDVSPPSSPYSPPPVRVEGLEAFDPTAPYDRVSTDEVPSYTNQGSAPSLNDREIVSPELLESTDELYQAGRDREYLEERGERYVESYAESYAEGDAESDAEGYAEGYTGRDAERYVEDQGELEPAYERALERAQESTDDYGSTHAEFEALGGSSELYYRDLSAPPIGLGPERSHRRSSLAPDAAQRLQSDAPGAIEVGASTFQDLSTRQSQEELNKTIESVKGSSISDERDLLSARVSTGRTYSDSARAKSNSLPIAPQTVDHVNSIYRAEGYEDLKLREESTSSSRPRPKKINQAVISQVPASPSPELSGEQRSQPSRPLEVPLPELSTLDQALSGRAAISLDAGRVAQAQQSARPSPINTGQHVARRRLQTGAVPPSELTAPQRASAQTPRLEATGGRFAMQLGVFLLIATLSWLSLPQLKRLLSRPSEGPNSQARAEPLPDIDSGRVPALPRVARAERAPSASKAKSLSGSSGQGEVERASTASAQTRVRLIIMTKAKPKVFLIEPGQGEALLCSGSMVCDIPPDRDVVVRAEGYYERPLYKQELSPHQGQDWTLNLVKMDR